MDEINKWQSQAKEKYKETQLFLKKLKKSKKKRVVERLVEELDTEAFEKIDCLECANCCKTISPVVTTADIKKIASLYRMKVTEVVEEFLLVDEDGDYVMKTQPCPFLGADNYCSIYEHRPKACREYPHTEKRGFCQRPALNSRNTLTCPAAFYVVEGLKERL